MNNNIFIKKTEGDVFFLMLSFILCKHKCLLQEFDIENQKIKVLGNDDIDEFKCYMDMNNMFSSFYYPKER